MKPSSFLALSFATASSLTTAILCTLFAITFLASCAHSGRIAETGAGAESASGVQRLYAASSQQFGAISGIVADTQGNLIIADAGKNCIHKMHLTNGRVRTLAGGEGTGVADGSREEAQFFSLTDITMDAKGNFVVIDGQRIRRITPRGVVTTFAGSLKRGNEDGLGTNARFNMPVAIAADDAGNVFVADAGNSSVRRINPQGRVETLAFKFGTPTHLTFDKQGRLLVLDRTNACVYALSPETITASQTVASQSAAVVVKFADAGFSYANFSRMTLDNDGNIVLVEEAEKTSVYRINPTGVVGKVAERPRGEWSCAGMLLHKESGRLLLINARDNGFYSVSIAKGMTNSQDSMTGIIENQAK